MQSWCSLPGTYTHAQQSSILLYSWSSSNITASTPALLSIERGGQKEGIRGNERKTERGKSQASLFRCGARFWFKGRNFEVYFIATFFWLVERSLTAAFSLTHIPNTDMPNYLYQ